MRFYITLFLILTTNFIIAQDTCKSDKTVFEDSNSITKCSIVSSKETNTKETRQISVNISAPRKRFLKKRIKRKKALASGVSELNVSGISNTNHSSEITNPLEIEKENTAINNIMALSNSLSDKEVKKAIKFHEVSKIPQFSNCEDSSEKEASACFNREMIKHIEKHFNYPNEAIIRTGQNHTFL